jgi:tetratricopeptide (TPR) repeat protein
VTRLRTLLLGLTVAASAFAAPRSQAAPAGAGKSEAQPTAKSQSEESEQSLPEEDRQATKPVKQYAFNPLRAQKELTVGNYYFKKGSWNAAAGRFKEATGWNPNFAEAYLMLGEAQEKLNDPAPAREAFRKFLELAPNDKRAEEIKKKLAL